MGMYAVKPRFRTSLRGVERRAIDAGIGADQLTAAGTVCALAAGVVVLLGALNPLWLIAAAPLVLMRLVCNALDGMIACDTGSARPLGQVYNEFADRVGDSAILFAITLRSGSLLLGAVTVTLVLLTSYLGTVAAAAGGTRQYVGVMGKADRMAILAAAAPLAAFTPALPVLVGYLATVAVGSVLTMLQRWIAIQRELSGVSYR